MCADQPFPNPTEIICWYPVLSWSHWHQWPQYNSLVFLGQSSFRTVPPKKTCAHAYLQIHRTCQNIYDFTLTKLIKQTKYQKKKTKHQFPNAQSKKHFLFCLQTLFQKSKSKNKLKKKIDIAHTKQKSSNVTHTHTDTHKTHIHTHTSM